MKLEHWLCENVLGWSVFQCSFHPQPCKQFIDGGKVRHAPVFEHDRAACMELFEALCEKELIGGPGLIGGTGRIERFRQPVTWLVKVGQASEYGDTLPAAILAVARQYAVSKGWKEDAK